MSLNCKEKIVIIGKTGDKWQGDVYEVVRVLEGIAGTEEEVREFISGVTADVILMKGAE